MHPRYAREWLEQQAVAGSSTWTTRPLPAESGATRCPTSTRPCSPTGTAWPSSRRSPGWSPRPRSSCPRSWTPTAPAAGVGWRPTAPLMRTAQADANRPLYLGPLGSDWLPVAARGARRAHRRRAGRRRRLRRGLVVDRDRAGLPGRRGSTGSTWTRRASTRRAGTPRRRRGRPGDVPPRRRRRPCRGRGRLRPGHRLRVHPRHARPGVGAGPARAAGARRRARCW